MPNLRWSPRTLRRYDAERRPTQGDSVSDQMKSFEFAAARAAGEKVIGSFQINGEQFDIRPLKDTSVAVLVHRTRSGRPDVVLAAVLDFTEKALTPSSAKRFSEICLDPYDGLAMDEVIEVFRHVLGVVGANPTGSASSSSPAPRKTGSGSRASTRTRTAGTL